MGEGSPVEISSGDTKCGQCVDSGDNKFAVKKYRSKYRVFVCS